MTTTTPAVTHYFPNLVLAPKPAPRPATVLMEGLLPGTPPVEVPVITIEGTR
jgi:hypothetical protein